MVRKQTVPLPTSLSKTKANTEKYDGANLQEQKNVLKENLEDNSEYLHVLIIANPQMQRYPKLQVQGRFYKHSRSTEDFCVFDSTVSTRRMMHLS